MANDVLEITPPPATISVGKWGLKLPEISLGLGNNFGGTAPLLTRDPRSPQDPQHRQRDPRARRPEAHRKRIGSSGGRPVTYDRTAYCGRNVIAAVLLWLTDSGDTT